MENTTTLSEEIRKHIIEFNDEIRNLPTSFSGEELYDEVKQELINAVSKNMGEDRKCGILFSGGIDSVVIAQIARKFADITCYTAAMETSQDLEFARKAAEQMGLRHKVRVLEYDEISDYAKKVVQTIGEPNVMKVGVGIPIYASCEIAKEKRVLGGFGGEELFVGYAKFKDYADWEDLQNRLWEGLYDIGWKDKYRDCLIAKKNGKELRSPMLDIRLVKTVMRVHPKFKINEKQDKVLLRKIARDLGVPDFICNRPKKATQYGSGVDKAIRRLAKDNGYREPEDYLATFLI